MGWMALRSDARVRLRADLRGSLAHFGPRVSLITVSS
jgi:hypothetical protein